MIKYWEKEKQLCQDKDRSICVESRKSNLALELVLKRTIIEIQKRLTGTYVGTCFNSYLYVETDISDVGNQTQIVLWTAGSEISFLFLRNST